MTALSDPDLLMAAILAEPEDDNPRLQYADCLDERGKGDRAEFIRVQCELVSHPHPCLKGGLNPGHPWDCRGCALRRREKELLAANFGAWTDFLPDSLVTKQCPHCADQAPDYETNVVECRQCDCTGVVPDHDRVEFRRGFVAEVACDMATFLRIAAGLAAQPVTAVRLVDRVPELIGREVCWVKERPGLPLEGATLPAGLFALLQNGTPESGGADWLDTFGHTDEWVIYPSREAALDAASLAACNHVRSLAPTTHRAPCPRCKDGGMAGRVHRPYPGGWEDCPDCDGGWVTRPGLPPLVAGVSRGRALPPAGTT